MKIEVPENQEKFNWLSFLEKNKYFAFVFLAGLTLLGAGLLFFLKVNSETDRIEILTDTIEAKNIMVDIEGAVLKPGVYKLDGETRVSDLLSASGGLSATADRSWVEQNLNLASKLKDGMKIYIPKKDESQVAGLSTENTRSKQGKINLNSATASELESLWGVGPATAKKIIEGRPYTAVDELLTKKIMKSNVYEKVQDQLSVY